MIYYYTVNTVPDLDNITLQIKTSHINNYALVYLRWDEVINILEVLFLNALSIDDKIILDNIIYNY